MADIPHNNNFDLLRLVLAFNVCLSHLGEVSGVANYVFLGQYFHSELAVDCFFVVSGFLIFRSYARSSSLASYLDKRLRRIYPAYVTVIVLSATILPLLTTTAGDLFFSREWIRYLLSNLTFLNFLQPELPGVFVHNNMQIINAPLWTIKVEVMFYLSVPLIFLLLNWSRRWISLFLLYGLSIGYSMLFLYLHQTSGEPLYFALEKQLPGQLAFFISGGGLYLYFQFFKLHYWKFLLFGLCILTIQVDPLFSIFYPLALAITVISFALCLPYLGNWGKYGDLSYGVYIYHFPVIQIFALFFLLKKAPWPGFLILILTILLIAFSSYHLIERPFLRKSSHYRQAAENRPSP